MAKLPSWAIGLITILASLALGVSAMWASGHLTGELQFLVFSAGGVIITSGVFAIIGSYIAQVHVAKLVSEQYALSQKLERAGILGTATWPLNIPQTSQSVDIFVIRARTWFPNQFTRLSAVLKNEGATVRICLVHPDSPMIPILASKFNESQQQVRDRILSSIFTIVECAEEARRNNAPGTLSIKGHRLVPTHTYYRFDDESYVVWYPLKRGRVEVPILRIGSGDLLRFFSDDFEKLLQEEDIDTLYETTLPRPEARAALGSLGLDEEQLTSIFRPP